MRDSINAFIETNFFKVRYIFEDASHNAEEPDDLLTLPDVSFERISPGTLCDLDVIYLSEDNENYVTRVQKRVDEPVMWLGFIARYDGKPAGCFWMLVPQVNEVRYDSFQVTPDMALFCGAYVNPLYRGRRIYNAMQYHAYKMLTDVFPDRKLVIIVERSNHSSLKSILRSRYLTISGKNYLFKLMGRNILSFYLPKSGNPKIWLAI
jgi:hypothetical protein